VVDVGTDNQQDVLVRQGVQAARVGLATSEVEVIVTAEGVGPAGPQGAPGTPVACYVQSDPPPSADLHAGDMWIKEPPVLIPQPTFIWNGSTWRPIYGEVGVAGYYQHDQPTPSTRWTINHLLHYQPQVRVENTTGNTVRGSVDYPTIDTVTIDFSEPIAGTAYLS
jgi:hypothetical protein